MTLTEAFALIERIARVHVEMQRVTATSDGRVQIIQCTPVDAARIEAALSAMRKGFEECSKDSDDKSAESSGL